MKLLELFKGTGSVGTACQNLFDEIISLDREEKWQPTIVADILEWDYTIYPPGHFDYIWASPPCTEYSIIKQSFHFPQNLEYANQIVQRVLQIIEYFKPQIWFIENPQSGLLKNQSFMRNLSYIDCDYCLYSDIRWWSCVEGLWGN